MADLQDQMQSLATPPLEETQEAKDARVKEATSRRPGFRGDGPFDFAGFGSYLKENVSEEELIAGLDNAGEWLVPFYDAGSNMVNVIDEYTKPEEERDYDYIQSELSKAGTSAAAEGAMWLMGGLATKYGIKGVKALSNKAKQYEIDPNSMSAFGVGAIKKKSDSVTLPPAENAARTQIAGTLPTYKKADTLLTELAGEGKTLDFGAGLGLSKKELGFDTYEPFPKGDFTPDFTSPEKIPSNSYKKITNLNVLNVVPREVRDGIVRDIGRILEPNGTAVITTRGRDVMAAKGNPGPEPMSIITSKDTYQKGFTQPELRAYVSEILGDGFEIVNNKLGAAGVTVQKLATKNFSEGGAVMEKQMEMAFGGSVEEIDPVSGNEVPPGSTPKEVRDDIPAMLSEGEYVVPADVTRFYGVKFFEDLREQAKVELSDMEANGRIGGEPVPEGEDDLTEDEMALLQEVMASDPETMGMFQGGMVNQQTMPSLEQPKPMPEQMPLDLPNPTGYTKAVGMAAGGMPKDPFGNPLQPTQTSPNEPAYSMLPVNPASAQGIYGITTASGTPYTAATPAMTQTGTMTQAGTTTQTGTTTQAPVVTGTTTQDPVVTETTTTTDNPDDTSGMRTVFYINKDCVRISVLMLNGNPISSVPADFNGYVEDTPDNSARFGCSITNEGTTVETDTETTETATEGATVSSDDDTSLENYKVNVKTLVDDTPEGNKTLYEDSGVNVEDPLNGAKDALKDTFKVSKGLGTVLGAVNPYLGLLGGVANTVSQLSAVSQANANLKMAEFLGKTEDAAAIQKEIDSFLEKAPGVVRALDSVFAKGTERFNNALFSVTSVNADESVPYIYNDDLNEVGKSNVNDYLLANSPGYAGATIDDSGIIKRVETSVESSIRPNLRPDSLTDPKSTAVTDPKVTSVKTDPKTGEPKEASIAYNPEGTNTAYMDLANSLTPNDGRSYVGGELVDDKTNQPWEAPKKDTVTTSSGQKVKIQTGGGTVTDNTGKTHKSEGTVVGGTYAGDGFEWKKSDNGNYNTRVYTGVNENATGSNDTSSSTSSSSSSGDSCCFIMLEARYGDGTMDEVVRRYRDEYMTDRNRRGYYKLAEVLVPLMRKSKIIKWVVTKTFADPLVSYGKYYYGENKHGVVFAPVKSFWMKVFDVLGGDTEFIRENGEVV